MGSGVSLRDGSYKVKGPLLLATADPQNMAFLKIYNIYVTYHHS